MRTSCSANPALTAVSENRVPAPTRDATERPCLGLELVEDRVGPGDVILSWQDLLARMWQTSEPTGACVQEACECSQLRISDPNGSHSLTNVRPMIPYSGLLYKDVVQESRM